MSESFQNSSSSSSSTPTVINTPQSDWGLQLSKVLSILAQGQYSWAMDQYNNGKSITDSMIANFMQLSGQGAGLAQKLISQYNDQFAPLNAQYIAQANSYNSEARQRSEMGKAESGVNQAMTAAANAAKAQLQSFGLNPSDGRYQALLDIDRTQKAAAMAGAGQKAALDTADRGRAMTEKAIQFGQNVPGMAVNATNSATQASTAGQNANLGQQNAGATLSQTAAPFFNASAAANKLPPVGQTSASGSSSGGRSSSPDRESNSNANRQGSGADGSGRGTNPNDMGYGNGNGGPGARSSSVPGGGGAGGIAAITKLDGGPDGQGDTQQDNGDATDWSTGQDNSFGDFADTGASDYGSDPSAMPAGGDNSYGDYYSQPDTSAPSEGADTTNYDAQPYSSPDTSYDNSGADTTQYADTSYDSGGGYDEGFDEGGPVPKSASPSRGRQTDDISARLNAGEYVIPRDVVSHRGPDYFRSLIQQSRRSRSGVSGPPPKAKLRPALNRAPTFVSR